MQNDALSILKQAILLERRGKAFYAQVAAKSASSTVKTFFESMAAEEETHEQLLSEQYKAYQTQGKFIPAALPADSHDDTASKILTEKLKEKISAAGFIAAAISAAMSMEEKSISVYRNQANITDDLEEKSIYQWLANWETRHLEQLSKLDRELTETIWNDNSFWPF